MARKLTTDGILIEEGRVLLVKRKHAPFRGYYALPGGHVEKGEDVRSALAREVREETGLKVKPSTLVGYYDDPGRDRRGNVSIAYLCERTGGKLEAGSDSSEAAFFPLGSLPGRVAFDHRLIIRDASKAGRRTRGKGRKVLAGGVFNIIHPGHVHFMQRARRLGDRLVLVVASDRTVRKRKKTLLFPARVRARMVKMTGMADKVVIGDSGDMMRVVRREKPDVIALGYDQDGKFLASGAGKNGAGFRVVRVGKLKGYSTKRITGG